MGLKHIQDFSENLLLDPNYGNLMKKKKLKEKIWFGADYARNTQKKRLEMAPNKKIS